MSIPNDPHAPRVPVHPGGILADMLADRGLTAADLADAAGLDLGYLEAVLLEAAPLTPEASLRIARALGTSTGLWAGLQSAYDLDTARAALGAALDGARVLPGPAVVPEAGPTMSATEAALRAMAKAWQVVVFSNNCPAVNDLTARSRAPKIGDLVLERSSFRESPDGLGWLRAFEDGDDPVWVLETLDGREVRWANASFIAMPPSP